LDHNAQTRFLTNKGILLPILILCTVTTMSLANVECATCNTSPVANISNQSQQSYFQAPTGVRIVVLVFDLESHKGIANASVVVWQLLLLTPDGSELWAGSSELKTNSSGYLTLDDGGFGTYNFEVSKSGYDGFYDRGRALTISENGTYYWEAGLVKIFEQTNAAPQVPDNLIIVTAMTLVVLFSMLFHSRLRSARTRVRESDRSVQDQSATTRYAVPVQEASRRATAVGKCIVCNMTILKGQATATCPFCGGLSHKLHLQEWLHVNDECPACHRKLKEQDLD
jgi:endogenous inhibitor of DNA gyrase (YacG/DUF329 family)